LENIAKSLENAKSDLLSKRKEGDINHDCDDSMRIIIADQGLKPKLSLEKVDKKIFHFDQLSYILRGWNEKNVFLWIDFM
jgi:hypothetical protein